MIAATEPYILPAGELAILAMTVSIGIYVSSARLSLVTMASGWARGDARRPGVRVQVNYLNLTLRGVFVLAALTILAAFMRFVQAPIWVTILDIIVLSCLFLILVAFAVFHEKLNAIRLGNED